MDYIDRNPLTSELRAEIKDGGSIPPSYTSGFSWRTIIVGVLVICLAVAAVVLGLPLLFAK
jgi:hypothetical protein